MELLLLYLDSLISKNLVLLTIFMFYFFKMLSSFIKKFSEENELKKWILNFNLISYLIIMLS